MKFLKNKKAGIERYFSFIEILMYLFVSIGVFIFIMIFSAASPDIRANEAKSLNSHIYKCLIENGKVRKDFFDNSFSIYEVCNLRKELFSNADKFYFRIRIFNSSKMLIAEKESRIPHSVECELQIKDKNSKAEEWFKCNQNQYPILYFENNQIKYGTIEILTGSNNRLENF